MSDAVIYQVEGDVAVLAVNNPPVNALSHAVRVGLVEGLDHALADDTVRAIMLIGMGRTFPAGADIREFVSAPKDPWLPEVCNRLEAASKPVIAAVHGTALGGGFEVALGAHYRIADDKAAFGLPEVTLGILPGAGGTQRAPRLGGAEVALDLMLSGRPMKVTDKRAGVFFDRVVSGDLRQAALEYAAEIIADGANPRPTRDITDGFRDAADYQSVVQDKLAEVSRRPEIAPVEIVRCVEAAALLPFDTGMAFERAAFDTLVASDHSDALRHIFFAERKAAKLPELAQGTARDIDRVGIVGGGTMGAGIAAACLSAGLRVMLVERDGTLLDKGLSRIRDILERDVRRGRLGIDRFEDHLSRLQGRDDLVAMADMDLVIEAVIEEMDVKQQIFAQLDGIVGENTVLATNTSYLDINEIASVLEQPEMLVGLHFFSPAHVMRLLEVVVGERTGADAVATGVALAKRLGKIPVRSGVCDGFIGNSVFAAYRAVCDFMMEDGASPYEIDKAMRSFGMALGPFQVSDLAGLDIAWARRKRLAPTRDPADRYVVVADRLCERGWFGQKTGRGYYRYPDGARKGEPDPEVLAIIEAERAVAGIVPRSFSVKEIQRRVLAAMANTGARLLREGIATRPGDIDTVLVHGYGYPRWRGGPMKTADQAGLLALKADLERFAAEYPRFWQVEPVFDALQREGRHFSDLDRES
ncbi:3-hydroxyacyl-CoA dehydrogenase NAD-binding domain-containing protein [Shimia biformata]|uniref:3-hydroxyacyl-CoA dehydrogenase NAD-binding domain-containing protein n=1 Tax=Shimia biformata TaxID=1294299 RepID=UPI00194DEFE2|nr:3-hydroxyacyl-CoA dehydrogenase NAD-binding domain-containing protein [Shimia biformata]